MDNAVVKLSEPTYELLVKLTQKYKLDSYLETITNALHLYSSVAEFRSDGYNDFLARNTQSRREKSINIPSIERIIR